MPRSPFIPTWFDNEQYLGLVVTFTSPTPSRWRLEHKINDREYHCPVAKTEVGDVKGSTTNLTSLSSSIQGDCEPESLPRHVGTGDCDAEDIAPCWEGRVATSAESTAEVGGTSYGARPDTAASYGGEGTGAVGDGSGATGGTYASDRTAGEGLVEKDEGGSGGRRRTCEACAVYICRRIDDQPKGAQNIGGKAGAASEGSSSLPRMGIMKIRLQIPPWETATASSPTRASHATTTLTSLATAEIEALGTLKHAKCASAPHLIAWKQERQPSDAGVPGGFVVYVLMELLPGVRVGDILRELGREERDLFRQEFRAAWLACKASGVINLDKGIRNLLWDGKKKKCYIIDFELFRKPTEEDTWKDTLYLEWNLAWLNDGDPDDISTWEL